MPFFFPGVDMPMELPRSDVERLVAVELDTAYLREKVDLFMKKQEEYNANVVKLTEAHAIAMDREKRHNRLYSVGAGILGGILSGLFGRH